MKPDYSPAVKRWMSKGGKVKGYSDGGDVGGMVERIVASASSPAAPAPMDFGGPGSGGGKSGPSINMGGQGPKDTSTQKMQPDSNGVYQLGGSDFGEKMTRGFKKFGGAGMFRGGQVEYDGDAEEDDEYQFSSGGVVELVKALKGRKNGR